MATTAQCPSCSTRFRVVPDQLKISKGWVRCGKCSEVFDARFSLSGFGAVPDFLRIDPAGADAVPAPNQVSILLRQESVEPWEEASAAAPVETVDVLLDDPDIAPATPSEGSQPVSALASVSPHVVDWTLEDVPRSLLQDAQPEPEAQPNVNAVTELSSDTDWSSDGLRLRPSPMPVLDEWRDEVPEPTWGAANPPSKPHHAARPPTVGFVRQARRKAVWQRTGIRVFLFTSVLLLSAALTTQVLLHERDRLAAHWPESRPWLMGLCEWLDCTVQSLRHIEAISITSTDLIRLKTGSYRFDVVLRNASDVPVALPWVELALTDRQTETVASRVIVPGEWLSALRELPPKSDTSLSVPLQWSASDAAPTDGFRAEVFYP